MDARNSTSCAVRSASPLALHGPAGERLNELIAAHPHVTMNPPYRQEDLVLTKRHVPRQGMLVVGIDQRTVNIQNHSLTHTFCSSCAEPRRAATSERLLQRMQHAARVI
jgi:hypothetical protein